MREEEMLARMEDLEGRVKVLEEKVRKLIWVSAPLEETGKRLLDRYGEYVDKTVAARILGVTRATVYAMLADGRIRGGHEGRRVDVRSIGQYMDRGNRNKK